MNLTNFSIGSDWVINNGISAYKNHDYVQYECRSGASGFDKAENLSFRILGLLTDITKHRLLLPIKENQKAASALDVQVAGDHYKNLKIQPVEYIHANNIPFIEGSVIKYVTRWKNKNGIKDLEKAKHFIELLIELESKNA